MSKRKTATPIALLTVALLLPVLSAWAQQQQAGQKKIKTGLTQEDWKYTLADGVTSREVTYYSDGVGCYARIFFPKGFSTAAKTPGIVLGQGWAGTHFS